MRALNHYMVHLKLHNVKCITIKLDKKGKVASKALLKVMSTRGCAFIGLGALGLQAPQVRPTCSLARSLPRLHRLSLSPSSPFILWGMWELGAVADALTRA